MVDGTPFAALEEHLAGVIPPRVRACDLPEAAYCLLVYYDSLDTPQDDYVSRMRLVGVSVREQALKTRGKHAPDGIWIADNTDLSDQHRNLFLRDDAEARRLCGEIYQLLARNEEATLRELRQTIQRVCQRLNQLDWATIRAVTDDFVVYSADGSHTFYDDYGDLVASVPAERLALLREHGYLGPADSMAQL